MRNPLFLPLCIFIMACTQKNSTTSNMDPVTVDSLRTSLLNADHNWNNASLQKGYYHSRPEFAAEDGIELNEGDMPLAGKKAISDYSINHGADDSMQKLQWVALKAEVSSSGELGYTYGSYSVQTKTKDGKDTVNYGAYLTVWKRQPDGSWKFLVDAPVSTPQEVR